MSSKKPRGESQQPKQAGESLPVIVNGNNQASNPQGGEQITQPQSIVREWLGKLGEPLTIVTLLLFGATVALYFATRDLVNDAEHSSELQLRAYAYAAPDTVFHVDDKGGVLQAYTWIGNSGRTPSKNVERWVGINILPFEPDRFELLGEAKREEGKFVLGPQVRNIVVRNFRPLRGTELSDIMGGGAKIFVFGKITYLDIFDKPHTTIFCHMYFGAERLDRGGGLYAYAARQAKYCEHNNETR